MSFTFSLKLDTNASSIGYWWHPLGCQNHWFLFQASVGENHWGCGWYSRDVLPGHCCHSRNCRQLPHTFYYSWLWKHEINPPSPPTDRETFRTQQEKKQSRCNHAEYEFTTLGSKWDSCVSVDVPRIEQARWVGFDMFCRRIFAGDL